MPRRAKADPTGDSVLNDADIYVRIAVAVVRRAVQDLETRPTVEQPDAPNYRDALDFLTRRLWVPECLWADLLGDGLSRPRLMVMVQEALLRRHAPQPMKTPA